MKLSWNKEDMKKRIEKLQETEPKSIKEQILIESSLETYEYIDTAFIPETHDFSKPNKTKQERKDVVSKLLEFKREDFSYLPKTVSEYVFNVVRNLDTCVTSKKQLTHKQEKITNLDIRDYTYQVFSEFNPKYIKQLDYLYDNQLIYMVSKDKKRQNDLLNSTFLDFVNKKPYVCVDKKNNFSTYATSIHEIIHAFDLLGLDDVYKFYNRNYNGEARSIFGTFYTSERDKDNIEAFKYAYNYIQTLNDYITRVGITFELMSLDNITEKSVKKALEQRYDGSVESTLESAEFALRSSNVETYVFSSIISFHLLNQYKYDKEKGMYLFDKAGEFDKSSITKYFKDIEFNIRDYDYGTDLYKNFESDMNLRARKIRNT